MKFLANENFLKASYQILLSEGYDTGHIGETKSSILKPLKYRFSMKNLNLFQHFIIYLLCVAILFQSCGTKPDAGQDELINKSRLEGEINQKRYLSIPIICGEEANPDNKQILFINLAHSVNEKKESELKISAFVVFDNKKILSNDNATNLVNLIQNAVIGMKIASDADFFNTINFQKANIKNKKLEIKNLNIDQIKEVINSKTTLISLINENEINAHKFGFNDYFLKNNSIAQINQTENNPTRIRLEYVPPRVIKALVEIGGGALAVMALASASAPITLAPFLLSLAPIIAIGVGSYELASGIISMYTGENYDTYWEELWNWLLVDESTSSASASWGDPHLKTFDNLSYDFQAVGEYVYLKSASDNFEVQVRQEDINNTCLVSFNTAVAINTGREKVAIYANPTRLTIDGKAVNQNFTELPLKEKGKILKTKNAYLISTTEGDSISILEWKKNLDIYIAPNEARKGKIKGISGNFDGNPDNDL